MVGLETLSSRLRLPLLRSTIGGPSEADRDQLDLQCLLPNLIERKVSATTILLNFSCDKSIEDPTLFGLPRRRMLSVIIGNELTNTSELASPARMVPRFLLVFLNVYRKNPQAYGTEVFLLDNSSKDNTRVKLERVEMDSYGFWVLWKDKLYFHLLTSGTGLQLVCQSMLAYGSTSNPNVGIMRDG